MRNWERENQSALRKYSHAPVDCSCVAGRSRIEMRLVCVWIKNLIQKSRGWPWLKTIASICVVSRVEGTFANKYCWPNGSRPVREHWMAMTNHNWDWKEYSSSSAQINKYTQLKTFVISELFTFNLVRTEIWSSSKSTFAKRRWSKLLGTRNLRRSFYLLL